MLLASAVAIHAAGRVAAFCSPFKVDSFVYSVAAYRLYDADVTIEDLVGDKPPGQALMTGWIYRVLPGPPTRLAMVPLESAFMLAGFAVFWRLAIILFGRWPSYFTICAMPWCAATRGDRWPWRPGQSWGSWRVWGRRPVFCCGEVGWSPMWVTC